MITLMITLLGRGGVLLGHQFPENKRSAQLGEAINMTEENYSRCSSNTSVRRQVLRQVTDNKKSDFQNVSDNLSVGRQWEVQTPPRGTAALHRLTVVLVPRRNS